MPAIKQRIWNGMMLRMLRHSRFFDAPWYRRHAGIGPETDAARHYLEGGWRTTDPSPYFDQAAYLASREDVRAAGACPLAHWLAYGRKDELECAGIRDVKYARHPAARGLERAWYRLRNRQAARRNRGARILAAVHLDDARAAGQTGEYLRNLAPCAVETVVTVPEGTDAPALREAAAKAMPGAEILTVPDRGRDTGGFLEALRARDPGRYDLTVKVYLPARGCVLDAAYVHRALDRLLCGAADAAGSEARRDPAFRETMVRKELGRYGMALAPGYRYMAGGCLALRADKAAELVSAGLSAESLEPSGQRAAPRTRAVQRYLAGRFPAERQFACGETATGPERADEILQPGQISGTVAFAVSETGEEAVKGDYFTALELAGAMEKLGWKTRFLSRADGDGWYRADPETDAVVAMLEDYDPGKLQGAGPGLVTVAWARNWFRKWTEISPLEDYALVLATGGTACRDMVERTGMPVRLFPIATNPERFHPGGAENPEEEARYACDWCFTGNRFGNPRTVEEALHPEDLPYRFRVYGDGWADHPRLGRFAFGHVPYGDMPAVYRGAKIVVDDATPSTMETGSVNSRVFDALAAGCLVLTNNERGAGETFGGLLPVFRNREELAALVREYLEDGAKRQGKVQELRKLVLEKHTYRARAEELTRLIREARTEEA